MFHIFLSVANSSNPPNAHACPFLSMPTRVRAARGRSRSKSRSSEVRGSKECFEARENVRKKRIRSAPPKSPIQGQPYLEKLCLDAIAAELIPGKTPDELFCALAAVQLPILMMLSRYVIRDTRFEMVALLNMFGHWLGFIFSSLIKSNKWFDVIEDITYLSSFFYVYHYSIPGKATSSQKLVFLGAFLWMLRLLAFLAYRISQRGSDWRFDALIQNNAYNFFGWTCGGTWCYLNGFCLWTLAGHGKRGSVSLTTWIGILIQIIGLAIETLSDYQKYQFREINKKAFITGGLWKYSRHPNYLGEIINWCGLAIASVGALDGADNYATSASLAAMCFVSPMWSCFFLFFTSLMLLEKRGNVKWKNSTVYASYKKKTPILFPVHI